MLESRDRVDLVTNLLLPPHVNVGTSSALDSIKIEGDVFFYAMQATWRLLDLAAEKRIDPFEWTESVGHYFKVPMPPLDRLALYLYSCFGVV